MKTLLFAPASYNFAETMRMVEIARACRDAFRVVFASYGGDFEWLITDEKFPLIPMHPRLTPQKIARLYRIMRWEVVNHPFGMDHLTERVRGELRWLGALKPTAVVTGLCLSWPVSCRVAGTPLVWVAQTTSLAPYWRSPRATWPDLLDYRPLRRLPDRLLNYLARYLMNFNRVIMMRFNAAVRLFGAGPSGARSLGGGSHPPGRAPGIFRPHELCRPIIILSAPWWPASPKRFPRKWKTCPGTCPSSISPWAVPANGRSSPKFSGALPASPTGSSRR
jgi:hypothetical protein